MLGDRLYIARLESGLTLEKIAEILDISYQAYRKFEKNICYPKVETLMKIAEMYNLSIDYLLGYTNDKKPLREDNEWHDRKH